MLKLSKVNKIYRGRDVETRALQDIDLEVAAGEFLAVMGPSGCGKSTLLNIIGLLDEADSGELMFQGESLRGLNEKQLSALRKQNVGFIFQNFNLIDNLSVAENIEVALLYRGLSAGQRREKINAVMDRFGIAHRSRHFPGQLSGGQQQRVAIARAVVAEQPLLLADEPTGNLDSSHGRDVMHMLASLNDAGTTVIMVTHSDAHADFAQRKIHLFDGRIINESQHRS